MIGLNTAAAAKGGGLEALLAPTAAINSTTAAATHPQLIANGFADLLSLLGVAPMESTDAATETDPAVLLEPTESKESSKTSPLTLKAAAAVKPAAPDDIAAAVIRAMLQPAATIQAAPALPANSQTQATEPALLQTIPTTTAKGPSEGSSTKKESDTDSNDVETVDLTSALSLIPSPGPAPAPAATHSSGGSVPIQVPLEQAMPGLLKPSDSAAVSDKPAAAVVATSAAVPNTPLPIEPSAIAEAPDPAATAPIAFALRLTQTEPETAPSIAKAVGSTQVAIPLHPDSVTKEAPGTASIAPPDAPNARPDERQPASDGEPNRDHNERTKVEKAPAVAAEFKVAPEAHVTVPASHSEPQPVRAEAAPLKETPPVQEVADIAPPSTEAPRATPAHEIAVRVSSPDASPVDVHVAQRGGEVRVAVRTADDNMQTSLRQDLGKLVDRLEQTGFRTETVALDAGTPRWDRAVHTDSLTVPVHRAFEMGRSEFGGQGSDRQEHHSQDSHFGQQGSRQQQQQQQRRQQRQAKQSWEDFV